MNATTEAEASTGYRDSLVIVGGALAAASRVEDNGADRSVEGAGAGVDQVAERHR